MNESTTPSEIATLISRNIELKEYYENHQTTIEGRMVTAETKFAEWRQDRDRVGQEGQGSTRFGILQGTVYGTGGTSGLTASLDFTDGILCDLNAGTSANLYLHIRLPLKTNTHSEMFKVHLKGLGYFSGIIYDETFVGYCYKSSDSVISTNVKGDNQPAIYKGTDDHVYLRVFIFSSYYLTLRVDAMKVGNGRLFEHGELYATFSVEETL